MRVFLDANVLFSAAKSDGAVRQLLARLATEGHNCMADMYVLAEARRNLQLKEPAAMSALDELLRWIPIHPARSESTLIASISWLPDKDQPVLAAAIRLRCDVLVTGDRTHFGAGYGKTFDGVTIHSPRSLAEVLFG
jgi:uncharacterized protein